MPECGRNNSVRKCTKNRISDNDVRPIEQSCCDNECILHHSFILKFSYNFFTSTINKKYSRNRVKWNYEWRQWMVFTARFCAVFCVCVCNACMFCKNTWVKLASRRNIWLFILCPVTTKFSSVEEQANIHEMCSKKSPTNCEKFRVVWWM